MTATAIGASARLIARAPEIAARAIPSRHRGDIDGLRAISVLAVTLFHIAPARFPAGGLGVDIFFVISGYLIGGIVLTDIEHGRFSFAEFYIRRVRRIAPALLVSVASATMAALVLLYPWELKAVALSGLAALGCGPNIYFWATSDYFAAESASLPLLHTWSLGVEEQFYFLFPLLLLSVGQRARKHQLLYVLLATLAVSLAISVHQVRTNPMAAFYLLPSRWWELMAGVAAVRLPPAWAAGARRSKLLALAGFGLLGGSFVFVDPARGFPGLAAAPACAGAALLLVSGQQATTPLHRLLAFSPLRAVGLASYSIYLWHWPVIVFYKTARVIGKLWPTDALIVIIATFVLGFASWYFVERPFRRPSMSTRRMLTWCGGLLAMVGAGQLVILAGDGFPSRIPPRALAIARYADGEGRFPAPPYRCFLTNTRAATDYDGAHCLAHTAAKPNWLLVGDSHAAMLWGGLRATLPQVNFQTAVVLGCDVRIEAEVTGRTCDDLMHRIFADQLVKAPPAAVLLTWRWTWVEADAITRLAARLRQRGTRLIVIGPTPDYSTPVARILAESVRRGDPGLTGRALNPELWRTDDELRALSSRAGFVYLSPMHAMCPARTQCVVTDEHQNPIYIDTTHYNKTGSLIVARRLFASPAASGLPAAALGRPVGTRAMIHATP